MASIISHQTESTDLQDIVKATKARINGMADLSETERDDLLNILDGLCEFELGRFLLQNGGGWNGEWTHRIISHREDTRHELHPLEEFTIFSAPSVLATRERFSIFQQQTQRLLKEGCHLASVPCGVMADLLTLDFTELEQFQLTGIDLDEQAFPLAEKLAAEKGLSEHCQWIAADAWKLDVYGEFDVLTSNGLNIYQSDNVLVISLYQQFRQAIKPGGTLITSFLTPPPDAQGHTAWNLDAINIEDLLQQQKVMAHVLQATWACFQTEEATRQQLHEAGFEEIDIHWGSSRMFPTVVAR
ncbi:MAG: class I SAM-dependent methyltransferase [Pseudomonadota bacterium]